MFSGNLRTTGLERPLYCQRHPHRTIVLKGLIVILNLPSENLYNLPRPGQRTPQKRLLACKCHRPAAELGHDRNHHSGQQT